MAATKHTSKAVVVLVSAPTIDVARRLVQVALKNKLIACANLIPRIESHYWWQGKIESSREILIVIKSQRTRLKQLEALISENHPYDTPEFICLSIEWGSHRYLSWLATETRAN